MATNSQDFNLFLTVCERRVLCHFEKALGSVLVMYPHTFIKLFRTDVGQLSENDFNYLQCIV